MKSINHVSVNTVISKVIRDFGVSDINEDDIIEWTGEALQAIGVIDLLEEAVAIIEVKDFQAQMPNKADSIIQIARKYSWVKNDDSCNPKEVLTQIEETKPVESTSCYIGDGTCGLDGGVPLDCDGAPLFDIELQFYRPYYDFKAEYFDWRHSGYFQRDWSPIRLKTHTFFNSIVCEEEPGLYNASVDEYTIIGKSMLRFSFKEGLIAIAFTRPILDEEGLPMIPDTYSALTAVSMYINYKMWTRMYYNNRQGSENRMQKAESDWQWYVKQASNEAMIPKGLDQMENMLQARNYLLPRNHRYNSFYNKMARPEDRRFLNPNHRGRF